MTEMRLPEDEQIRVTLSEEQGAGALTSLIYDDPLPWLGPLAAIAQAASGVLRKEAFIALATTLMPAIARSRDRIPLDQVLPALRAGVSTDAPSLSALWCARVLGVQARPLVSDLRLLLGHQDPTTRYVAASALVLIEPSSGVELLACLLDALATDRDEERLLPVYDTIARLGSQAAEAAPLLRQHLATATEEESREAILDALRRISA